MMQQKQLRQDKARSTGIGEIKVTKNKRWKMKVRS